LGEIGGATVARVRFVSGSVADAVADAIVNPVGSGFLVGFAGVNGALRTAGGEEYTAELHGLPTTAQGDVWPTGAGRLKARHVLHVVSPIWTGGDGGERDLLRRQHQRLLEVADGLGCRSVALPAIGCGAHRFPVEVAAEVAVSAVEDALVSLPQLERVEFFFLDRRLLHDYYLRSKTYEAKTAQFTVIRSDIVNLLRHDTELAALVGQVDDPAVLRAIDDTARELGRELSIGVAFLYARAARQVLQLESGQAPARAGTGDHSNPSVAVPENEVRRNAPS
jgi:O-acetyl-ADP-ribose deacetylase (regulator of RNase III)